MDKEKVVIVSSPEQLNQVVKYSTHPINYTFEVMKKAYSGEVCKSLENIQYCSKKWYSEHEGYEIISFEEFEKQYLKKEEPKKPELIPGKWYKNLGGDGMYCAKLKKLETTEYDTYFTADDYLYKNVYNKCTGGDRITSTWEKAIECSLEEIQQWLPEGHPDKIAKVEDFGYVESLTTYNNQFTKGKIYKLSRKPEKDHFSVIADDKGEANGWGSNHLKLSTKEAYDKQQNDKLVIKEEVKMADKQQDTAWSVKYCPEFTQEIFNHLIKWCEERFKESPKQIWRDWTGKSNDKDYSHLVKSGYFVYFGVIKGTKSHLCGSDNNTQGKPEISVKEMCSIIGYEQMKANKFIYQEEAMKSEEPVMEKGKWYEFEQTGNCGKWLLLMDRMDGPARILYSKCISIKYPRPDNSPGGWGNLNMIVEGSIKPANMDEVYKYFPEEKPKSEIMDEIDYYAIVVGSSSGMNPADVGKRLAVLKKKPSGKIENPYYHDGVYFIAIPGVSLYTLDETKYGNCAKSMIKREDVPVQEEKWIPKVGDYCVYQNEDIYLIKALQSDTCTLEFIKVKNRKKAGGEVQYDSIHFSNPDLWRKARPEEIPVQNEEFKAGDWIIITDFGRASAGTPGDSFQLNTPYQLSTDFTESQGFYVVKDSMGHTGNGWSNGISLGIKVRKCSPNEIPSENKVESPKEKPMEKVEDNNWCVKLTPENKQAIIDYSIKVKNRMSGSSKFYGYCKSSSFTAASSPWGKELTTEEFYQKMGVLAPKSPESDNWCVQCTKENSEILKAWTVEKGCIGMLMNNGAWYGWEKGNVAYGSWDRTWGKVLTTEEFYQKIGKVPSSAKISNEALLEEAKRRYPIGTMYQALNVDGMPYGETKEAYRIASFITDANGKHVGIDVGYGYIYIFENNRWAEIISTSSGNFDYEEIRPAKINVELYKPKQNTQINENVTKITSISSQLVKPKKVVLF